MIQHQAKQINIISNQASLILGDFTNDHKHNQVKHNPVIAHFIISSLKKLSARQTKKNNVNIFQILEILLIFIVSLINIFLDQEISAKTTLNSNAQPKIDNAKDHNQEVSDAKGQQQNNYNRDNDCRKISYVDRLNEKRSNNYCLAL